MDCSGSLDGSGLFLVEGIPAILLGVIVLVYLTDRPETADWLSSAEKDWLVSRLAAERTLAPRSTSDRHLCSIDEPDDLASWDHLSLRCDWFLRLLVLGDRSLLSRSPEVAILA